MGVYAYTEHRIDREVAQRAVATPETAAYTDQQLYESRAEGPNRPECEVVRQRAARNVPTWLELNFISAFGCLTPVEERIRKLENQALYPPRNRP
jgi:hypothetical protein